MRLGKLPVKHDDRTLQFRKYATALAPAPRSFNPIHIIRQLHLTELLNDQLGDCTVAAAGHTIEMLGVQSGKIIDITDPGVQAFYSAVSGYVPGQPNTDNGAYCIDVLNRWRKLGLEGHLAKAYVQVAPYLGQEVVDSLYYFGNLYIGLNLPITCQQQSVWTVTDPKLQGDAAPGSWGGHCVPLFGYDREYLSFISWGQIIAMSWQFFYTYCDEAYCVLAPELFNSLGNSPHGFDLAALTTDLAAL